MKLATNTSNDDKDHSVNSDTDEEGLKFLMFRQRILSQMIRFPIFLFEEPIFFTTTIIIQDYFKSIHGIVLKYILNSLHLEKKVVSPYENPELLHKGIALISLTIPLAYQNGNPISKFQFRATP